MSAGLILISGAALWVGYVFVGYPIALYAYGLLKKPRRTPPAGPLPRATVVVCAHNEEEQILARIRNVEAQSPDLVDELVIASDGSSDATVATSRAADGRRVRVLDYVEARGRALTHSDVVATVGADVVVFTDAETRFLPGALDNLLQEFRDPGVGMVVGNLLWAHASTDHEPGNVATSLFWRLESGLRRLEERAGLLHTASGPFMAMRTELFVPLLPDEDVDFSTPFDVLAAGYEIRLARDAWAVDVEYATLLGEFRARRRMVAKNLRGSIRKLVQTRAPLRLWWAFTSHKVMRWTLAVPMSAYGLGTALAWHLEPVRILGAGAALVLAYGVVGGITQQAGRRGPPIAQSLARFMVAVAGMGVGVLRSVWGPTISRW